MKKVGEVTFQKANCDVYVTKYARKPSIPAIVLIDQEDGMQFANATILDKEVEIPENHVFIKNYSENEGIMETLIEAGIISEPVEQAGPAHICKLLANVD